MFHISNVRSDFRAWSCDVLQGVGRAIAVSKSIMLGEALPPLRLQLQDSYGNVVPATADTWADKQVQLQMLQGSLAAGGSVIQELLVEAKVVSRSDPD